MSLSRIIAVVVGCVLVVGAVGLGYLWSACRAWVPPDKCLVLIRKTGDPLPAGQEIAEPGQKGIQRQALGPGRYFYNPWIWDWELRDLIEIPAGDPQTWREVYATGDADYQVPKIEGKWPRVGIVTSLAGKPSETQSEVVEEGYQGIQRRVLTPGTYRLNPRAYKVELADAVVVPLGCCGVVTSQLGDMPDVEIVTETLIGPDGEPIEGERKQVQKLAEKGQRGVLKDILQPGIYYLNPYVHKVTIVQIGYNEISQLETADMRDTIRFPSNDGFTIEIEVTVVWGRHPEHAPEMIARFGDVNKIKQIIFSQIRSICRNIGSRYDSIDFIRGEKREEYQRVVTETLQRIATKRDIEILIALIQNYEVRGGVVATEEVADLRSTIQRVHIAREEEITRQKQRETAKVKAELETAEVQIEVAREQIIAETRKKVAEIMAEGNKKAEEIDAQRDLEVARIERQIAQLDAEKTRVLGKANADVEQLRNQSEADGKRMLIDAFGTGRAYNLYTFADQFEPESIRLIFAGEGTFWTDLSRLQDAAAMELLKSSAERK
jgi:hypothetical protein